MERIINDEIGGISVLVLIFKRFRRTFFRLWSLFAELLNIHFTFLLVFSTPEFNRGKFFNFRKCRSMRLSSQLEFAAQHRQNFVFTWFTWRFRGENAAPIIVTTAHTHAHTHVRSTRCAQMCTYAIHEKILISGSHTNAMQSCLDGYCSPHNDRINIKIALHGPRGDDKISNARWMMLCRE